MYKKNRLGLDIDNKELSKRLLKIFRILKIKGFYRISSNKRGYHFSIKVNKHTKKEALIIRYMFNDCYGRWIGDVRRLKAGIKIFDVLFFKKKNKKAGSWRKI